MKARDKFKKGDRVRLSESGRKRLHKGDGDRLGSVVGFSAFKECVRVLRDGNVEAATYHMNYWDVVEALPPSPPPDPIGESAA